MGTSSGNGGYVSKSCPDAIVKDTINEDSGREGHRLKMKL